MSMDKRMDGRMDRQGETSIPLSTSLMWGVDKSACSRDFYMDIAIFDHLKSSKCELYCILLSIAVQ